MTLPVYSLFSGSSVFSSVFANAAMCAGVVPQQPPRIVAPASIRHGAYEANSSAAIGKTVLPFSNFGNPALGLAISGILAYGAI